MWQSINYRFFSKNSSPRHFCSQQKLREEIEGRYKTGNTKLFLCAHMAPGAQLGIQLHQAHVERASQGPSALFCRQLRLSQRDQLTLITVLRLNSSIPEANLKALMSELRNVFLFICIPALLKWQLMAKTRSKIAM